MQDRLKRFSFPTVAEGESEIPGQGAKKRVKKPRGTKASKVASRGKTSGNPMDRFKILAPRTGVLEQSKEPRTPGANKFFKHSRPMPKCAFAIIGGVLKLRENIDEKSRGKGVIYADQNKRRKTQVSTLVAKCDAPARQVEPQKVHTPHLGKRKSNRYEAEEVLKRKKVSTMSDIQDEEPAGNSFLDASSIGGEESQIVTNTSGVNNRPRHTPAFTPRESVNVSHDVTILRPEEEEIHAGTVEPGPSHAEEPQECDADGEMHGSTEIGSGIPTREPSPASDDSSRDLTPVPCDVPLMSPSPSQASRPRRSSAKVPPPSEVYDPSQDAFGFARMQPTRRGCFRNPFMELTSPTKKPKELTPKISVSGDDQPSIVEALEKSMKERVTSTPSKKGAQASFLGTGEAPPPITSTPWEAKQNPVRHFYGASTSASCDGFRSFSRLIDRSGSKQLQIDAGQKKFGASECKTCGMVFSQGEAEEEREHQKFHKQMVSALHIKPVQNAQVLDVVPNFGRVLLVTAGDTKQLKERLADAIEFANKIVGLDQDAVTADFATHPDRMYAIFVKDSGDILSILGTEPAERAQRTLPGQGLLIDSEKYYPARRSIFFVWTVPNSRRKGLAALLLYRMRAFLADTGCDPLSFDEIAFADLTPDLHKFVIALSGKDTVLVTS
ncbi:N-acetyltransferase ESCO2 [Galendromus occidentalis]|uniref:N-acetyltransferase ESCO2 n=1 Tax=Galendromus occidentalis TaxID=34638 RepID=A0AAJ7L574_9ACAR|nr:N-acetyltransferase ESCO2 [Galendromus occidentalis]